MISVQQFSSEFSDRHDFEYEDSEFLKNKYNGILFLNIPKAWVCSIDSALSKMNQPLNVRSISQVLGFVVFDTHDLLEHDRKVLLWLEKQLVLLDKDLHEELDEGIILH
jgi:hypothetical protein